MKYILFVFLFLVGPQFGIAQKSIPLTIVNDSFKAKGEYGNITWNWSIWVVPDNIEDLDRISYVEYALHETFPDPTRRVTDKYAGNDCFKSLNYKGKQYFRFCTNGWGEFDILVKVVLVNGNFNIYKFDLNLFNSASIRKPHPRHYYK
ncbi:pYEATS domain-containing protein [Dyadobacter bucti]|uniref:pYEATS domain-containing protein n=1 Tax=Dyadobacter bucti TaxID=2572203 RepID=UPI0011083F48|nr:pYEATS domain-containing protein [Dyadobacter bucti]